MYCPPGASALGGICSLGTGKIYLLNFPLNCNKQLIISYIHPFSHPKFYFDHLLPSIFKVLSSWPPPPPSTFMLNQVQTRTMHCLAIPLVHVSVQLPLCGCYSTSSLPPLLCNTCSAGLCYRLASRSTDSSSSSSFSLFTCLKENSSGQASSWFKLALLH